MKVMVSGSILVTGAHGFIGRQLVSKLIRGGHNVTAFVKNRNNLNRNDQPGRSILVGDITNPEDLAQALRGCQQVYHLASVVDLWNRDRKIFHQVNVQGTENLLIAARNAGVKRVLVCSSCGIFGPSQDGKPIDETKSIDRAELGLYESSKFLQSELARKFNSPTMQTVIAYPTRVFGPGPESRANTLTSMLHNAVERKRCFVPGNGRSVGNYVFVEDVVRGLELIMNRGQAGEGYILGGENLSYLEMIEHLQRSCQTSISVWRIPVSVLKTFAILDQLRSWLWGTRVQLTVHAVNKYTADWPVSSAKAQRELGYQPTEILASIRQTMRSDSDVLSDESCDARDSLRNKPTG